MSQTCQRCYKIVDRACQSDTETLDCVNLRRKQILDVAKNNALVAKDQHDCVEDYEANMRDTIAELFPDWTREEAGAAEAEFQRVLKIK